VAYSGLFRLERNARPGPDLPRDGPHPSHRCGNARRGRPSDLATLLALFPDARLVLAEREHGAVLRSAVSLAANQMAMQSDTCDLAAIKARWQHKIALRETRMAAALAGWQGPVARLDFDELGADWEGAIARCYADLVLTLTPAALTAMRKQMAASETGHHHAHSAQLARFAEVG
jgi:Sulfotransferase family